MTEVACIPGYLHPSSSDAVSTTYAVLVWRADVDGEPVYEVAHGDIREAEVAATLTKRVRF